MTKKTGRSLPAWIAGACASLLLWQAAAAAAPTAPPGAPLTAAHEAPPPVAAADPAAPAAPAGTAPALTAQDLGVFFDGLIPYALKRDDIAGGVFAVVKDGAVLFSRGYGYADLAGHRPMSPSDTLVRPGSISKLFTWTAVMQLVEQGRLSLDRDINDYLDFRIPPYEGRPVTLRNLMTHMGGFEEVIQGLLPKDIAQVDLERYLKTHIPARIFPPGEVVAYSNYGCGLAGYIVQRVSGERFDGYVAHHLFQVLRMTRSTFEQPLPSDLAPMMATGYKSVSDGVAQPFELVDPAPAGALSTSALDIAQFMIAQLQGGALGDARILSQATTELMHRQNYTPAPGMPGYALGFYQEDRNGLRIIGHAGDTEYFHSDLHLLLDRNVGLFMSFNSAGLPGTGAHLVRRAVLDAFMGRYFPHPAPEQPTAATAHADAARVAGWYSASRRNESALRWLYLLSQTHVTAEADDTVTVSDFTDYTGRPIHWREVGPLQYRQVDGTLRLDFLARESGRTRYFTSDYIPPVEVFQRVPDSHGLARVGWPLTAACVVVLVALLSWPLGALVRRHYQHPLLLPKDLSLTRRLSRLGLLAITVDLVGWLILIAVASADEDVLMNGTAALWMLVLHGVGVVALTGGLAVLVHTGLNWRRRSRSWKVLLGETLTALAVIYLAWFIPVFGLISFNVRF